MFSQQIEYRPDESANWVRFWWVGKLNTICYKVFIYVVFHTYFVVIPKNELRLVWKKENWKKKKLMAGEIEYCSDGWENWVPSWWVGLLFLQASWVPFWWLGKLSSVFGGKLSTVLMDRQIEYLFLRKLSTILMVGQIECYFCMPFLWKNRLPICWELKLSTISVGELIAVFLCKWITFLMKVNWEPCGSTWMGGQIEYPIFRKTDNQVTPLD